jgi:arginyl-tRNA synthetase
MIRDDIEKLIAEAVRRAQEAGDVPAVPVPEVAVERPQRAEHGDYASSLPLRLGRSASKNPMEIAEAIVRHMEGAEEPVGALSAVEVAPPGFINLRLSQAWLVAQVDAIVQRVGDAGCRWSTYRRTRWGRSTWATAVAWRWAIRWPGCWRPPATRSSGSIW